MEPNFFFVISESMLLVCKTFVNLVFFVFLNFHSDSYWNPKQDTEIINHNHSQKRKKTASKLAVNETPKLGVSKAYCPQVAIINV